MNIDKRFTELLNEIFHRENLIKLVISDKRKKSQEIKKATVRPLLHEGQLIYQIEYTIGNQVTQENTNTISSLIFNEPMR